MQGYRTGVMTSDQCGTNINHSVTVVGWGTHPLFGEYYLAKNSLGTTWGAEGYVKIGIEDGIGVCGIHSAPYQPHVF